MDILSYIRRKISLTSNIIRKVDVIADIRRKISVTAYYSINEIEAAPLCSSAEVGLVDAFTIALTFDKTMNQTITPASIDFVADFSGTSNELITAWTHNTWQTFTHTGKDITSAINNNTTSVYATSNDITVTPGQTININLTLVSTNEEPQFYLWDKTHNIIINTDRLSNGVNAISQIIPTGCATVYLQILNVINFGSKVSVNFSAVCSATTENIVNISSLAWNSSTELYLTLDRAIQYGETGTISYIPGTNKLTGTNGGLVAAFTKTVTNNCVAPPAVIEVEAYANPGLGNYYIGIWVDSDFDELKNPEITDFIVTLSGGAANVESLGFEDRHGPGYTDLILRLDRVILFGETGTVQYIPNADATKKLQGLFNNYVVAFTDDVINNIPASIPVLQSITVEDAAPYDFVHTYDIALDETSTPATTAYAIAGHTVSAVVVSGLTVTVTCAERVYWGDTDTSAYTKPLTNMIKSTLGGEADSFTATAVTNNVAQLAFQNANTLFWGLSKDLNFVTKDGSDLVSVWTDRNGGDKTLPQAVGSKQPLWTSAGILFLGVDEFLQSVVWTWNQPCFIYMIIKPVTYASGGLFFDGKSAQAFLQQYIAAPGNLRASAGVTLGQGVINITYGAFSIVRVLWNGANSKVGINTTITSGNAGTNNPAGITLGGSRGGTSLFSNILIPEIILRNVSDSAPDEAAIYSYLISQLP